MVLTVINIYYFVMTAREKAQHEPFGQLMVSNRRKQSHFETAIPAELHDISADGDAV